VPTLLLVDDSEVVREVLRLVAAADGRLEVVGEAVNGREGVDAAERLQPDAIILDVAMPVMTGLEALPLLRERAPKSLVVVYAGGAPAEIEPAALAAGAAGYYEKGVSAKTVITGTVELLEGTATPR
jgi:DNA-binding NarL/FixJ family response regulator